MRRSRAVSTVSAKPRIAAPPSMSISVASRFRLPARSAAALPGVTEGVDSTMRGARRLASARPAFASVPPMVIDRPSWRCTPSRRTVFGVWIANWSKPPSLTAEASSTEGGLALAAPVNTPRRSKPGPKLRISSR